MAKINFAPWIIFHIPHSSTYVPPDIRKSFLLNHEQMQEEFVKMTDFWTLTLYGNGIPVDQIVASQVSRLVVDVERFSDDSKEAMSRIGMGVVYTKTHDLKPLRGNVSFKEKQSLLSRFYLPHHQTLQDAVDDCLAKYGKALVLDLHSFPSRKLPYEGEKLGKRPEICIGTDDFHTPSGLSEGFREAFGRSFDVGFNAPFSGALVPMKHYWKDKNVSSVMVETRRDLYQDETDAELRLDFGKVSRRLRECLSTACRYL